MALYLPKLLITPVPFWIADTGHRNETDPTDSAIINPPALFGPKPMQVKCGNCQRSVLTSVVRENGACAYIATLFVCLLCHVSDRTKTFEFFTIESSWSSI
ncbi:hypothetical protein TNCV_442961 [Trichonephila clavipes]|nr:hypothetical protein TNCV_442961 [Trichonephila clavipes]